ncbi:hypothetical protein BN2476_230246 [Paraburkholderia piptadeniae]|uniref:Uncharacterized protein n=1 Tax=Paraburkholderia piptadeniae TaxID=1701573 RepID=A0A1N7RXI8_9BURK|nr:hypothetical protein BN2476_230246 [Paraburkholderia piptadeniae]
MLPYGLVLLVFAQLYFVRFEDRAFAWVHARSAMNRAATKKPAGRWERRKCLVRVEGLCALRTVRFYREQAVPASMRLP